MIYILLFALIFGVAATFVARYLLGYKLPVRWTAFVAVPSVIVCLLAGWGSYAIAHHVVQRGAVGGYHQFLNGTIIAANVEETNCTENGSCVHEYDCHPYLVPVTETTTDSNGKVQITTRLETRYNSCPYATKEYTYILTNSFGGKQVLASHILAENPREWEAGKRIPGSIAKGVPEQWRRAADGIKRNDPVPVTVRRDYDNYILSSESTILRTASSNIDTLKKKKLLPDHTQNLKSPIYDVLNARKMSFVGFTPANENAWQDSLMRFNAGLGMQRQGDLHIVAIKSSVIPSSVSPDDYLTAIKAYWLNNLGKDAIAKNGIILVLAVDDSGKTIKWARAGTGMPVGNGVMIQSLNARFNDQAFAVDTVLGQTKATITGKKVSYSFGSGIAPQTIMVDFPFQRACMACTGKDEASQNGFVDLSTEIDLHGMAVFWTILIDLFVFSLAALAIAFASESYFGTSRSNSPLNRLLRS